MLKKTLAYQTLYWSSNQNTTHYKIAFLLIIVLGVSAGWLLDLPQTCYRIGFFIFFAQLFHFDKATRTVQFVPVSKQFKVMNFYLYGITIAVSLSFIGFLLSLALQYRNGSYPIVYTQGSIADPKTYALVWLATSSAVYFCGMTMMLFIKRAGHRVITLLIYTILAMVLGTWLFDVYPDYWLVITIVGGILSICAILIGLKRAPMES